MVSTGKQQAKLSYFLLLSALVLLPFADIEITTQDPWTELGRLLFGLVTPDLFATEYLLEALFTTISFALLGVAFGVLFGFILGLLFHLLLIRYICAFVRSVHELFWALIFLQLFGLTPLTGILAIGLPYACTFAKVYAELWEQTSSLPSYSLSIKTGRVSLFFYTRLPQAWSQMKSYTRYRFECGLRTSTILGFVGLPTLGFHLESAFKQGLYSQAGALLLLFFLLIASIRFWLKGPLIPVLLVASLWFLPEFGELNWPTLVTFFGQDIWPAPLRHAESISGPVLIDTLAWYWSLLTGEAWEGLINTLLLTQLALVATALLSLLLFPLASKHFCSSLGLACGRGILVVLRSTPEMILAFVFLLLLGPSMLPAIVALAIHNGGLIANLIAVNSHLLRLRADSASGMNLYLYELLPKVYGGFMAFLFYRWEVILRESAILGILGVATLGFYIDSAFEDIRFDRAFFLILLTGLLNICVDSFSRWLRKNTGMRQSLV